jgi:hypothetical protein
MDKSIAEMQQEQQDAETFNTALDYIKELCDVLEKHPTDQQTVSNVYCNAMSFYDQFRPRPSSPEYKYLDGTIVNDLPFLNHKNDHT